MLLLGDGRSHTYETWWVGTTWSAKCQIMFVRGSEALTVRQGQRSGQISTSPIDPKLGEMKPGRRTRLTKVIQDQGQVKFNLAPLRLKLGENKL